MRNASGTKPAALQPLRLICCEVNTAEYCLDMTEVRGIGRLHQLGFQASLEGVETPTGALGWITSQQNQYPVFDLASQLDLASVKVQPQTHEGFVVLINAPQPFGLRVDRIVGNLEVEPMQMMALPHIVEPTTDKFFKGIVKLDDKWVLCADARKLHRTHPAPIISLPRSSGTGALTISAQDTKTPKSTPQIMLFSPAQKQNSPGEPSPITFGLSLKQIQEVAHLSLIIPVPNAPHYVIGMTNWREVPLPIIDLKARLGLHQQTIPPHQIDPKSRLLITRAPSGLLGVLIHPQVKAFPLPIPYQHKQQRLAVDQALVLGSFDLEGSPFVIPDLEAILTRNFAPQHFS